MLCRQPVQQVFIDVESHEMRDHKDTKGMRKSNFSVNEFPGREFGGEKGRVGAGGSCDMA